MAERMRAIAIREAGGPDVLQETDWPVPRPGPDEVLIRVAAAGVNRPDVLQRQGLYPLPPDASSLPGLEVSGVVVASGDRALRYSPGARVMALTHGGGYAEYVCAHEAHCLPVPDGLSLSEAAAVPETFFTVHYNVFMRGNLAPGESLLVHGGSSGIGSTAIQLAKAHGARVVTTAGSDAKCQFCRDLGADRAFNYREGSWSREVGDWSDGKGVNVILDMVAGSYLQKNLNLLARDGRYLLIALLDGPSAELNVAPILLKRLTLTGSTLRPQSVQEKAAIATDLERRVLPMLAEGSVRPVLFQSFPLAEASAAHALMETSQHMGKIVLEVSDLS